MTLPDASAAPGFAALMDAAGRELEETLDHMHRIEAALASALQTPDDAGAQTVFVIDKILAALTAFGARAEDIVRTRIYIVDEADVDDISLAHGRVFGSIKPANTLIKVAGLIGGYKVEIEAEAVVAE